MLLSACDDLRTRDELRDTLASPELRFERATELATSERPTRLTEQPEADGRTARQDAVELGTGRVLGTPTTSRVRRISEGEVILNFVDADIEEVARAVLADTLGESYVVDPLVTGSVTLHTSRPMALDELPALLETVLQINGAALLVDDGVYSILPAGSAAMGGLSPVVHDRGRAVRAGYGLHVVPLSFISADEVETLLRPFVPAGSVVQVDRTRNLVLLSGPAEQVTTALELIELFDVDWLAGMSMALYPLLSANAETLAGELQLIFGGADGGLLDGLLRFVPIPRLQAIMVISSQPRYLARAKRWIDELDRGADSDLPGLHIYYVQFGNAANLAAILRETFRAGGVTVPAVSLAPGYQSSSLRREPDDPLVAGLDDRSNDAAGVGYSPAVARSPSYSSTSSELLIAADEVTNSLVIRATPHVYRNIREALEQLDVMPLQVLIEATIAEISLRDQLQYGLQWFFKVGGIDARLSQVDSGAAAQGFPGFSAVLSSGNDVRVVLNALDTLTDVNVISSPQLLVLDNQTARLQVGDEVPVAVQQSRSTTDPDAPIVNTIEQRDTGVILEVTPRVNASGLTILQIDQEVSRVTSTTTSGIDSPTINQRRLTSTVAVHSGETVAMGGLIQETRNDSKSGVPILSRLPVLGPLFGTTNNDTQRTELLVLLTPKVLYDREDARRITDDLRRRLRLLAPPPDAEGESSEEEGAGAG